MNESTKALLLTEERLSSSQMARVRVSFHTITLWYGWPVFLWFD
jgi:hypothetical protein